MHHNHRQLLLQHSIQVLAASVLIIAAGFLGLDLAAAEFFNRSELQGVYYYSREVTNIGYSIHYFAIALCGLIFSKFLYPRFDFMKNKVSAFVNQQIFHWSWFSVKALVLVAIPLHLVKLIVGRKRPHVSENFNPLNFDVFNFHHHWNSFPSGHAQVLFTVATIALLIWPKYRFLFLSTAFIFALTRVSIHQHYFSDVVAGATLGYIGTLWLYYYFPPVNKLSNS